MNRYRLAAVAAVLAVAAGASRAAAEPGRYDAVNALISALPANNPGEDPDYMNSLGANLPDQMAACHWKADEMAAIERILALFKKNKTDDGFSKKALIADLGRLPDFAGRGTDKKAKSEYDSLVMGITLAADMTEASLVGADCRTMLKMDFDNGAGRDALTQALAQNRFALDSGPAPR